MKTFFELNKKFNKIKNNGWILSQGNGNGAGGITFEKLLNIQTNNFEIPDFKDIELKVKYSNKEKYISLFNATPDSFLYEIKRINDEYGYSDKDFPNYNIFQTSVYSKLKINKFNNLYFKLYINYKENVIELNVYDSNLNLIDNKTSWSFNMLKEKLERKLNKIAIIYAEKTIINGKLYFKYNTIKYYKLKSFNNFLELINRNKIRVCFSIGIYKYGKKFGQLYNHGTKFCINKYEIEKLFKAISID